MDFHAISFAARSFAGVCRLPGRDDTGTPRFSHNVGQSHSYLSSDSEGIMLKTLKTEIALLAAGLLALVPLLAAALGLAYVLTGTGTF